jgi:T-complex protein 1 subunit theta
LFRVGSIDKDGGHIQGFKFEKAPTTMMKNMRRGIPSLFKGGTNMQSGLEEAVLKNLEACKQLTEITRTSLGPHGMNKLIVNHLDKIFVTTDTATIMQEMEIVHPAAKMIVLASEMQEKEVGDGSNFVVCLSGYSPGYGGFYK